MSAPLFPVLVGLAVCFLVGSIPFAILAMMGTGIDIRRVGSGNPGFNNVLRVSKPRAVLALAGDVGKGYLAVWTVLHFGPSGDGVTLGWLCGSAAILGHCYSPFLKFNGGKGIATSGGVMLVLYPVWALVALVYFAVTRVAAGKLKWREAGTIASLTTWVLFALLMLVRVGQREATYAAIMTLFLAWRHRRNFLNLFGGQALAADSRQPVTKLNSNRVITPGSR